MKGFNMGLSRGAKITLIMFVLLGPLAVVLFTILDALGYPKLAEIVGWGLIGGYVVVDVLMYYYLFEPRRKYEKMFERVRREDP